MIFTEREAATKRCTPMQILWLMPDRDQQQGMIAAGGVDFNCIGSRCAQWRWFDDPAPAGGTGDNPLPAGLTYFPPGPEPYTSVAGRGKSHAKFEGSVTMPARGYCGLAGRIE